MTALDHCLDRPRASSALIVVWIVRGPPCNCPGATKGHCAWPVEYTDQVRTWRHFFCPPPPPLRYPTSSEPHHAGPWIWRMYPHLKPKPTPSLTPEGLHVVHAQMHLGHRRQPEGQKRVACCSVTHTVFHCRSGRERERESVCVCICSWSIGLGLEGWNLYPCVPVGARSKEPWTPTELEAPPLTVVMFALWLPGHALCFWAAVAG